MRRAAAHVDRILIDQVPGWMREGITEQELFEQIVTAITDAGMMLAFPPIVAFGENAAAPHHEPTDRSLKTGDHVLVDAGAVCDGWCSDTTRNFSLGDPGPKFLKKFTQLRNIQEASVRQFVAGAKCAELDEWVRAQLGADADLFIHTLGHGVGPEVHELPRIGRQSEEVLVSGMVVTCEPGVYVPGEYGIRIEDQLVVREGAPDVLTTVPRKLLVVDEQGQVPYTLG